MNAVKTLVCIYLLVFPFSAREFNNVPKDAIQGDFDGDGKPEYIWIVKPRLNADSISCAGGCNIQIVSSNPAIKPVTFKGGIGGTLYDIGDMDNDGKDDIGLLPDWFAGCWRSYITFTLKAHHWKYLVKPFPIHCNQWEDNVKPLEKIAGKKGYLKENYSAIENNDIVVKSKVVKVGD